MDYNSDIWTSIIESIFNSELVVFMLDKSEIHYIIRGKVQLIPGTYKADTPNTHLHSNIQRTEWHNWPDMTAEPSTVQEDRSEALAVLIKIPVAGPVGEAATMITKTPVSVAVEPTPMNITYNGTNLGMIMVVTTAPKASR